MPWRRETDIHVAIFLMRTITVARNIDVCGAHSRTPITYRMALKIIILFLSLTQNPTFSYHDTPFRHFLTI